jgi:hypothetical protein
MIGINTLLGHYRQLQPGLRTPTPSRLKPAEGDGVGQPRHHQLKLVADREAG